MQDMTRAIELDDESHMYSDESLKLLGFQFSNKPTVHAQVNNLISRAAGRSFVIRRLAGVQVKKERLKNIYCSLVRLTLKYSSITYDPMLAQYERNRMENIQKNCLRSIFGFDKSYEELLEESGLETPATKQANKLWKKLYKMSNSHTGFP